MIPFTATDGDLQHAIALDAQPSSMFTTLVRTAVLVGEPTAFPSSNGQTIASGFLYAQPVHLASAMVVTKLGVIVDATGPNTRMALYRDTSMLPDALVVATPGLAVPSATTEFAVTTPTLVDAGDYWIAANFESATHVRLDTGRTVTSALQTLSFAQTFPATAAAETATGNVLNYYIVCTP